MQVSTPQMIQAGGEQGGGETRRERGDGQGRAGAAGGVGSPAWDWYLVPTCLPRIFQ